MYPTFSLVQCCRHFLRHTLDVCCKGRGNVGHDPMYLCFYDHNFPYVVRRFNLKNFFGFAHTRFIFKAAVVWGGQVVETKIYFRFRHSTRPPNLYHFAINLFIRLSILFNIGDIKNGHEN
jgi:hypothetical protein